MTVQPALSVCCGALVVIKYSLCGSDPTGDSYGGLFKGKLCVLKITGSGFYLILHYAECDLLS